METIYSWKRRPNGEIITPPTPPPSTLEDLFGRSSFRLPVREVTGFVPVRVIMVDGKWIEQTENEKDRIWRLIVEASST